MEAKSGHEPSIGSDMMNVDFAMIRPSEDVLSRVKADEEWWYETGSGLYNSALILEKHNDLKAFKTTYVGEADGMDTSDDEVLEAAKTRVTDMLIGMAIEAWLKGLIVASGPKDSLELEGEVQRLTDIKLIEMGKTGEVTLDEILEAMRSREIRSVFATLSIQKREEAIERVALIRAHHHHDLRRMAAAVNFQPPLSEDVKWALGYYSQMIELGRYPAVNKPRELVHVKNLDALNEARKDLFGRILSKRDSLC